MGLEQQQNLLARLYTDAEFRRAFLSAPDRIGAENGLLPAEIAEIAAIMPEELNFFAESLFTKRRREVEKLLPFTNKILQDEFAILFREFAENFNPQTVKKHFEDALEFTRFLEKRETDDLARNAAKFERAKLEFFGFEKRIVVCRLAFDPRRFPPDDPNLDLEPPPKRKIIAVWLRFGKRVRHFFI